MTPQPTIKSPDERSWIFVFSGCFLLLCLSYWVVIGKLDLSANLAETNYQANMIRLGNLFHGGESADAILAGTSISGRILPRYFPEDGMQVLNLGLDGASALTALQLAQAREPGSAIIFLEIYGMFRETTANDTALLQAPRDLSFRLAGRLPLLQAGFRPSSVVYTRLKSFQDRRMDGREGREAERTADATPVDLEEILERHSELVSVIKSLQNSGNSVVLVNIPARYLIEDCRIAPEVMAFANALDIPVFDVAAELAKADKSVRYSDGLHLVEPSAREVARILAKVARSGP